MRRITYVCVAICMLGVIISTNGRAQKQVPLKRLNAPPVRVEALMQAKLKSAQQLLKGLALEDFELIAKNTQQLELLSLDADWNIVQTKNYARISLEFREAARHMRKAADKENLDAVGLGYMKLTMSCIDCHRHVRKTRKV